MQIHSTTLPNKSKLIKQYQAHDEEVMKYFHYKPYEPLKDRLTDLKLRKYNRKALRDALYTMNQTWSPPKATFKNIDQLLDEDSVVVVGGQQAGLLTGPLYTINKIISIIIFAKQQEEKLSIPVVPVFWIAGEDHDLDEVNHIYVEQSERIKKHILKQHEIYKRSLSDIKLDKQQVEQWINEALLTLGETSFTKNLFESLKNCLNTSNTFVDFFARCIFELFPSAGIVLLDAAHPAIRELEAPMFRQLIQNQEMISEEVYETAEQIRQNGYTLSLEVEKDDAHIFFHDEHNERILLKKVGDKWIGKQEEVQLTTKEMLQLANETPERLSNNVVTRPIMQEFLLPTLAFIGGHGEISYWATLKKAFHQCEMEMPPVIPRLSFTYVTEKTKKILDKLSIDVTTVLNNQLNEKKMNWLMSQQEAPIQRVIEQMKKDIAKSHEPIQDYAANLSSDMGEFAKSNLVQIEKQLNFLKNKLVNKVNEKYDVHLRYFDQVESNLNPNQQLQERVWSPLQIMNENGIEFVEQLLTIYQFSFEKDHYVVSF